MPKIIPGMPFSDTQEWMNDEYWEHCIGIEKEIQKAQKLIEIFKRDKHLAHTEIHPHLSNSFRRLEHRISNKDYEILPESIYYCEILLRTAFIMTSLLDFAKILTRKKQQNIILERDIVNQLRDELAKIGIESPEPPDLKPDEQDIGIMQLLRITE